jgi:hypothetical protein
MPKEVPKFGVKEVVRFVGLNDLSSEEQVTVYQLTTENYEKIKRDLNNITNLVVHIKSYDKTGHRKKYSLHVHCIAPTHVFESCNADDWELPRALHKAFEDIRHQIAHKMHSDVTRPSH